MKGEFTTKVCIYIPTAIVKQAESQAAAQFRTISEYYRECIRRCVAEDEAKELARLAQIQQLKGQGSAAES